MKKIDKNKFPQPLQRGKQGEPWNSYGIASSNLIVVD